MSLAAAPMAVASGPLRAASNEAKQLKMRERVAVVKSFVDFRRVGALAAVGANESAA